MSSSWFTPRPHRTLRVSDIPESRWGELEREADRVIALRMRTTVFVHALVALAFAVLSPFSVDYPVASVAFIASLVATAVVRRVLLTYTESVRPESAPRWRAGVAMASLVSTALFAALVATSIHAYGLDAKTLILVLVASGLGAGALHNLSPSFYLLHANFFVGHAVVSLACFAHGDGMGLLLGALIALHFAFHLVQGRRAHSDYWLAVLGRVRAEQQHLASIIFATAVAHAAEAIELCNADSRIEYINPAFERMTGYSLEDARGRTPAELLRSAAHPGSHPDELYDAMWATVSSGQVWSGQLRCRRKDGSTFLQEMTVSPVKNAALEVTHYVGIRRDITDRRRAEDALARSQRDLGQLIEVNPDAILILRGDRVVYVNPAGIASLGFDTLADVVGRPASEVVPIEPDRESARDVESAARDEADTFQVPGVRRVRRRDGEIVLLDISKAQTIEHEGEPASLVVARDVTERRRMEVRLEVADRMASLGMLAAGVAHEINNPLTYTMANLTNALRQLARAPGDEGKELSGALTSALDGAERVRRIVRDLQTLSRAEDERKAVDVHAAIASAIEITKGEIGGRARVATAFGDVPPALVEPFKLGQVLINLLVNASHAMDASREGVIEVKTSTDATGRVVIAVRDTGRGIPDSALHRVFDPFFTTKAPGVGTGLGLSLCHNIVTGWGGEIAIKSDVGVGTTVSVFLPAALDAEPVSVVSPLVTPSPSHSRSTEKEKENGALRRGRVLVLDDEPMIGIVMTQLLDAYDVTATVRAAEAHRLVDAQPFDLIFCDLMMPETTGMEFYEELSRRHPGMERRIVFMSGGVFEGAAKAFLARVDNPMLKKPFDILRLEAMVRDRLAVSALALEKSVEPGLALAADLAAHQG